MPTKGQVYKYQDGPLMVEILHGGEGKLEFNGTKMELMSENTVDAAKEKHLPVIEKTDSGYKVKVGEVAHPMQENHYIEWIELVAGDLLCRKYLKPGEAPEAEFPPLEGEVVAREYCNLHGIWKA